MICQPQKKILELHVCCMCVWKDEQWNVRKSICTAEVFTHIWFLSPMRDGGRLKDETSIDFFKVSCNAGTLPTLHGVC